MKASFLKNYIIRYFSRLSSFFSKGYIYPSHKEILRNLYRDEGVTICEDTLCNTLSELEQEEYFERVRRKTDDGSAGKRFASTLYILKKKLFVAVARMVYALKPVIKKMKLGFYQLTRQCKKITRGKEEYMTLEEIRDLARVERIKYEQMPV